MRILPEMCPSTTWPFSSFTRNVALGRVSVTSPCISITSSFAMLLSAAAREARTFEVRLLEQAFVLVRHDVGLDLGHEIHSHHHDDQQGGTPEVDRHVPLEDQEFRQQT